MIHKKYVDSKHNAAETASRARKAARSVHDLRDETKDLKERIKTLERIEVGYMSWKKREPEIRHYLKSFAGIAR
jgi:hypothetical protein